MTRLRREVSFLDPMAQVGTIGSHCRPVLLIDIKGFHVPRSRYVSHVYYAAVYTLTPYNNMNNDYINIIILLLPADHYRGGTASSA